MRIFGPKKSMVESTGFTIIRSQPTTPVITKKGLGVVMILVALSNVFTYNISKKEVLPGLNEYDSYASSKSLYLIDEASIHIRDINGFEQKVREVAFKLNVQPEWLMSVMYSESKFKPSAVNHKGSGATGLIQFMVPTVRDINMRMGTQYYMSDIRNMSAIQQMDLVYDYLANVQSKYGDFKNITDLYLAILFPRAVGKDYCYTLYSKPSKRYTQNSGLDENKDGRVTVSDIDKRMSRLFPTAYAVQK